MRILIVHNFYRSSAPSGENEVFLQEKSLLTQKGHTVDTFVKTSDSIIKSGSFGPFSVALSTPWSRQAYKEITDKIQDFKPDIVHIHNTFPIITPSIFSAIKKSKTASVLTLHNYRIFCPAAIPSRNANICTKCLDQHSTIPSLIHRCYRKSLLATVPIAANVELHRRLGTWNKNVDAFICLTSFQKRIMTEAGLPREKVYVRPNCFPGNPKPVKWTERENFALYAGRLSTEKGILTLIEAWTRLGTDAPLLKIAGDGPLSDEIIKKTENMPIEILGRLSAAETHELIKKTRLLLLPSEWFEGFPMVIREAFAFGTPIAASRIGSISDIISNNRNGILFNPKDAEDLASKVRGNWFDTKKLRLTSLNARTEFEENYTEESSYLNLVSIYKEAQKRGGTFANNK